AENLVRSTGGIVAAVFAVDYVVKVPDLRVPVARVETPLRLFGACAEGSGIMVQLARPFRHETKRVVPQGLDFHGLAAARRYHPFADLGVHPGELIAGCARANQTVFGVDADAVTCAAHVMVDDGTKRGPQLREDRFVADDLAVTLDGMEVPERGVHRVIKRLARAFGEEVGQQTVVHIVREGAQNGARFAM